MREGEESGLDNVGSRFWEQGGSARRRVCGAAAAASSQDGERGEVLLPIATRCFSSIPYVLNKSNALAYNAYVEQFSSSAR